MTDAVLARDLGHAYKPGRWVFRHCDFELPAGQAMGILGINGSGKTTLLHQLLGLIMPTEGVAVLTGHAAYVPQLFQVGFDYSVLEMVLMGRARRIGLFSAPTRSDEEAALAMLERFELAAHARRPFHELSGGQRQLAIIARALISGCSILILDEPASALDIRNQTLILEWIARLRDRGLTVIFTTHRPEHVLDCADRALLMLHGGKFAFGRSGDVLNSESLSELYGIALRRISVNVGSSTRDIIVKA
jgi:iron complex transport system ATP-binding protein